MDQELGVAASLDLIEHDKKIKEKKDDKDTSDQKMDVEEDDDRRGVV